MSIPLLNNSHGTRPEVVLDDVFPEGITGLAYAAEATTLLIATKLGHLTLLKHTGELLACDRSYADIGQVVWSAAGTYGAAIIGDDKLICFDQSLRPIWDVRITGRITALAIAPHGSHLAFSTDACRTYFVTVDKRETARLDDRRPLDHLAFLADEPTVIGASDFGSLCSYTLEGRENWQESVMNNIGDLSVSGCGRRILLSAFNHGIQVYNKNGKQRGGFMVDGIPSRVSGATTRTRLAAVTLENRVYWLNFDGELQWAADLSADPPLHIQTGPLGDRLFLATQSGRLMQLCWR